MIKKWQIYETDNEKVQDLIDKYDLNLLLATVLVNRNILETENVDKFMKPRTKDFHDPFLMPDMESAVNKILESN